MKNEINLHERFISVADFARGIGVCQGTIRKWMKDRKITYVKYGYAVRIPESEIDRLIKENLRPATAETDDSAD